MSLKEKHTALLKEFYDLANLNMNKKDFLDKYSIEKENPNLLIPILIPYSQSKYDNQEVLSEYAMKSIDVSIQESKDAESIESIDVNFVDVEEHADFADDIIVASEKSKFRSVVPVQEKPKQSKLSISKKSKNDVNSSKGYQFQAWKMKAVTKQLPPLLCNSSKVVCTKDWQLAREELRMMMVLQRIDNLKSENLWSFKQLKAHIPPERKKSQWDLVLEEALWLSEDFYQERKWKMAMAYKFAHEIKEWHLREDKSSLSSKRKFGPVLGKMTIFPDSSIYALRSDIPQSDILDNLPTLEPFTDEQKPFGLNQHKITPVSKFQFCKSVSYKESIWDDWGRLNSSSDSYESTKWLSRSKRYIESEKNLGLFCNVPDEVENNLEANAQNVSSPKDVLVKREIEESHQVVTVTEKGEIFIKSNPVEEKKVSEEIPKPLHPQVPIAATSPVVWSPDEEDALWSLSTYYKYNWTVISQVLREMRLGASAARSDWDCYEHFMQLRASQFKPQSKGEFLFSPPVRNGKATMNDNKLKALKLLNNFENIKKCAKKREAKREKESLVKPNKNQVNLNAHETHEQSQIQAGIDINQPPRTPSELSAQREKRERTEQLKGAFHHPVRPGIQISNRPISNPAQANYRPIMRPIIGFQPGMPMMHPAGQMNPALQMAANIPAGNLGAMRPPNGNFTPEQLAMIMNRQYMARPMNMSIPGSPTAKPFINMQQNQLLASQPQRIQADLNAAAAFVALNNAQQATKSQVPVDNPNSNKNETSDTEKETRTTDQIPDANRKGDQSEDSDDIIPVKRKKDESLSPSSSISTPKKSRKVSVSRSRSRVGSAKSTRSSKTRNRRQIVHDNEENASDAVSHVESESEDLSDLSELDSTSKPRKGRKSRQKK